MFGSSMSVKAVKAPIVKAVKPVVIRRSWVMPRGIDDFVCTSISDEFSDQSADKWICGDDGLDYELVLEDFGLNADIVKDWTDTMERFKAFREAEMLNGFDDNTFRFPYMFAERDNLCIFGWNEVNVKMILMDAAKRPGETQKSALDRWEAISGYTFPRKSGRAYKVIAFDLVIQQQFAILEELGLF